MTSSATLARLIAIDPVTLGTFQLFLNMVLPCAFVAGLLIGGFERTSEVEPARRLARGSRMGNGPPA